MCSIMYTFASDFRSQILQIEYLLIYSIFTFLVDDFNELSDQKNSTSKLSSIFKGNIIYFK